MKFRNRNDPNAKTHSVQKMGDRLGDFLSNFMRDCHRIGMAVFVIVS